VGDGLFSIEVAVRSGINIAAVCLVAGDSKISKAGKCTSGRMAKGENLI